MLSIISSCFNPVPHQKPRPSAQAERLPYYSGYFPKSPFLIQDTVSFGSSVGSLPFNNPQTTLSEISQKEGISPEELVTRGIGTELEKNFLTSPVLDRIAKNEIPYLEALDHVESEKVPSNSSKARFVRGFQRSMPQTTRNIAQFVFFDPNKNKRIVIYARSMGMGNSHIKIDNTSRSHSEGLLLAALRKGRLQTSDGQTIELKKLTPKYVISTRACH